MAPLPFDSKPSSATIFKICLTGFVLAFLLTPVACTKSAPTHIQDSIKKQQWAIIVGIGDYEYLDVDTRYADDDATSFYTKLEPIFGNDHVKLLVSSNATKIGFRNAIYDWLDPREDENDIVLFFLAGHGNYEFFQLYDSLKGTHNNDISPSELNIWLDILESKNIAIIMDFCESGSYSDNISNIGRIIITGCTGREKCWQEKAYEHGVFSYYLIEALSQFDAVDVNGDGMISAEELFCYLKLKVEFEFQQYPPPSPQHPYINDNHDGELILFSN